MVDPSETPYGWETRTAPRNPFREGERNNWPDLDEMFKLSDVELSREAEEQDFVKDRVFDFSFESIAEVRPVTFSYRSDQADTEPDEDDELLVNMTPMQSYNTAPMQRFTPSKHIITTPTESPILWGAGGGNEQQLKCLRSPFISRRVQHDRQPSSSVDITDAQYPIFTMDQKHLTTSPEESVSVASRRLPIDGESKQSDATDDFNLLLTRKTELFDLFAQFCKVLLSLQHQPDSDGQSTASQKSLSEKLQNLADEMFDTGLPKDVNIRDKAENHLKNSSHGVHINNDVVRKPATRSFSVSVGTQATINIDEEDSKDDVVFNTGTRSLGTQSPRRASFDTPSRRSRYSSGSRSRYVSHEDDYKYEIDVSQTRSPTPSYFPRSSYFPTVYTASRVSTPYSLVRTRYLAMMKTQWVY